MVRDTKLYDLLGVDPGCADGDMKKAYKKLAMKLHPDRNPDPAAQDKFKEISAAYDILSDPEKRETYDRYGLEGLQGGGGASAEDLFSRFFGGGGGGFFGGGGGRRGPRKTEDVVHPIRCSLEDLYKGKTVKLAMHRQVLCSPCKGSGSKSGTPPAKCSDCNGRGVKMMMRQIGPGMIQQMQTHCGSCKGSGEMVKDGDKCPKCSGRKTVEEKKILEVAVDKGMPHGHKIVFSGEADQAPGMEAGDIVLVVQQKEHDKFRRVGIDLVMEHTITLYEALTGFQFMVKHLDGRQLVINGEPGRIIKPGDFMAVPNEGMPTYRNPFDKGVLFVKFEVEFPKSVDAKAAKALAQGLPVPKPLKYKDDDVEEVTMTFIDPNQRRSHPAGGNAYDDDDDDDMHGGPGVQCASQ